MSTAENQRLTPRQREVLLWASRGKSSWCIGKILGISENTVLFHMKNIHRMFQVNTRQAAIARAVALGLLFDDEEQIQAMNDKDYNASREATSLSQ